MWIVIENRTIDGYAYLPCFCPGGIYIARAPWHFGDFRLIFLPNIIVDQN